MSCFPSCDEGVRSKQKVDLLHQKRRVRTYPDERGNLIQLEAREKGPVDGSHQDGRWHGSLDVTARCELNDDKCAPRAADLHEPVRITHG